MTLSPPKKPQRGVIYVVTGGRSYLGELMTSLRSLRQYEPDLPVTVFSTFAVPPRRGLSRITADALDNPHKIKVWSLRRSPYEETLFLDTDTLIRRPLTALFRELDGRDFCAANAHVADYSVRPPRFLAMVKLGGYNTGVLLFRRAPGVHAFLERWEDAVRAHDTRDMWAGHFGDQHFFNELLRSGAREACGLRWGDLDNALWNCRGIAVPTIRAAGAWPQVGILHHRTTSMKWRKMLYSATDMATARVIAAKGWRLATAPFRSASASPAVR